MATSTYSDRSRAIALALAALLGWAGGHRFYAGKIGTGILMLLTGGGLGVWWLIDFIQVAAGTFRDLDGKRIVRWEPSEAESGLALGGRKLDAVLEDVDHLRADMAELNERVDFMERLLTQLRERGAIPPS